MSQIDCEVVQDLFPSYIDGLTSEKTNEVIEEHLAGCEKCSGVLASMKGETEDGPKLSQDEKQEIDFLKKNKRKNRRIIFGSIAGALVLALAVLAARFCLIGTKNDPNWVPMYLNVNGKEMDFHAVPIGSSNAIADLTYTEENGVITVQARTVLATPLHKGMMVGEYKASETIKEVRVGNRIVWSDGATVSALASDLFATRHNFVGDMPANNRTAQALSLGSFLGAFTNELETAAEPYGWKILLSDEVPAAKLPQKEQDMDAFGRVIVGLIGNLDHVTFVYQSEGAEKTRTITAADASAFFGEDIKNCGKNVRSLDALIQKTGLALYAFWGGDAASEESWIRLSNQTDTKIYGFGCEYFKNGQSVSTSFGMNADETPHKIGDTIWMDLSPEAFGGSWDSNDVLEVEFSFETPDHRQFEVSGKIRVTNTPGTLYDFALTGNEKDGYRIQQ